MAEGDHSKQEVISLIPAGGHAMRIAPLPCSKELYPIGFRLLDNEHSARPKVVCHYLLEKMRRAGITKAYIILREGKWDIPAYLQDGSLLDIHIAYLIRGLPFGVPYTLDQAYAFVQEAIVAFGFPDVLFESFDAFIQLLTQQTASKADVVLGLFPAEQPQKVDMVDLDESSRVRRIASKPDQTTLSSTWTIAVWTPKFTQFLHDYIATTKVAAVDQPEMFMGEVIQAAIDTGLKVEAVQVSDTPYLDIGTPEDLVRAVRRFAGQES